MRRKLNVRLSAYWKMEAANAALLPFVSWAAIRASGEAVGLWVGAAMIGCGGLLVIGAAAWRMELAQMRGERALAAKLLRWLGPSRPVGIALAWLGAVAGVLELVTNGAFTASAIAALILGTLAVLEYVNYYIVQLQHFDHLADFRRLVGGRGFRKPHLAKATEAWAERQG